MRNNKKRGMAMLVVISLIIMLLIIGGAVLTLSTGHFGTSYHQIRRARAYYAAEAAMQHAIWSLRTGGAALPAPGGTTNITFPEEINSIPVGRISISVADQNGAGEDPEGVYPITITVDY